MQGLTCAQAQMSMKLQYLLKDLAWMVKGLSLLLMLLQL